MDKKYIDNHRKNIYFRDAKLIKIIEADALRNNKSFGDILIEAYCLKNKLSGNSGQVKKPQTADMVVNRGSRYEVKG